MPPVSVTKVCVHVLLVSIIQLKLNSSINPHSSTSLCLDSLGYYRGNCLVIRIRAHQIILTSTILPLCNPWGLYFLQGKSNCSFITYFHFSIIVLFSCCIPAQQHSNPKVVKMCPFTEPWTHFIYNTHNSIVFVLYRHLRDSYLDFINETDLFSFFSNGMFLYDNNCIFAR